MTGVMSLIPSFSFMWLSLWPEVNVREVLEASYWSEGAPQKSKSELCPYVCYDRCIRLLAFFSYFFCQFFVYSSVALFWCHPSSCCEDKGLNEDFSIMSITLWLYLSSFSCLMFLVDLCQGVPRIWLWGRICDPYVKESFLTAIPQSSRRDI